MYTDALKSLMDLAPQTAVIIKDNKEVTVSIDEVNKGDLFIVRQVKIFLLMV